MTKQELERLRRQEDIIDKLLADIALASLRLMRATEEHGRAIKNLGRIEAPPTFLRGDDE